MGGLVAQLSFTQKATNGSKMPEFHDITYASEAYAAS